MCRIVATVRASSQHKLARLPVGKIDRRETECWMHESSERGVSAANFAAGAGEMKKRSTTCWQPLHEANVAISVSHVSTRSFADLAR